MFGFVRRWKDPQVERVSEAFAGNAIWQLDKALMILANAKTLHSADEIKRSIDRAVEEIEPVFHAAKRASADLGGMRDADVD